MAQVGDLNNRLAVGMRRYLEQARTHLKSAARGLPRAQDLVDLPRQRFDAVERRLGRALLANTKAHGLRHARIAARLQPRLVEARIARLRDRLATLDNRKRDCLVRLASTRRARFEGAAARLRPNAVLQRIERGHDILDALQARGQRAITNTITRRRQRLDGRAQMLSALSYQGVLARGFAIVRDGNGVMVRSALTVSAGAALGIEFHDGDLRVQAIERGRANQPDAARAADTRVPEKPAGTATRTAKGRNTPRDGSGGQGTLF